MCLCVVVIVAFDMTNEVSLQTVTNWMDEASQNAHDPVKFLIGTKSDLLVVTSFALLPLMCLAFVH